MASFFIILCADEVFFPLLGLTKFKHNDQFYWRFFLSEWREEILNLNWLNLFCVIARWIRCKKSIRDDGCDYAAAFVE